MHVAGSRAPRANFYPERSFNRSNALTRPALLLTISDSGENQSSDGSEDCRSHRM